MGQAAVDLPDPLNAAAEPSAGSADDLLAQLAGKEIDRLLAEAQVDPDVPHDAPEAAETAPATTEAPAAALSEPVAKLAPELEQLLEPAAETTNPATADEAIATQAEQHVAALVDQAAPQQTADAEHSALQEPVTAAAIAAVLDEHIDPPAAPLPLLLRPLEWLNAPLALLPESAREAIGKIAIVTLLNAIAVLIYVMWVR